MFRVPEQHRIRQGIMGTDEIAGNNGAFIFEYRGPLTKRTLTCIASDGMGWEHVSVTVKGSKVCPSWDEMCFVKSKFWDEHDCVLQFHPPKEEYVNNHPGCLHLWRPTAVEIPLPESIMVGIK